MKKSNIIVIVVIIIVLIGIFAWSKHSSTPSGLTPAAETAALSGNTAPTVSAPVTENSTVSNTLSKYENDELGFSVQYPTAWAVTENPVGPTFTIPLTSRATTINTLQASVYTASGKCAFPQIASSSIKENTTVNAGGFTFNTISAQASAKGLNYWNRMYTLQQGTAANPLCYVFSFSAISKSINSVNQPVITAAEDAFSAMVKTFAIVTGPAGDSETSHASGK